LAGKSIANKSKGFFIRVLILFGEIWMQMKNNVIFILLYIILLFSCNDNNNEQINEIQTVRVTFINESSYFIKVHRDSFYGPIIAEVNTSSKESEVSLRPSEGTVFSIEYIWLIQIPENTNNEVREVPVSGIDPNLQFPPIVIELGKPCTIQIPNPKNLEIKSAIIIIINAHNLPIELRYILRRIEQADNNNFSIAPYRQGIYKLDGISDEGEHCQYYNIASTFESTYFSDFIPQNGTYITKKAYIYTYVFDGNSIIKTGEQSLIF
jgi:hypothetical protein